MMEPSSVPEGTTDEAATVKPLVERYYTREGEDVWATVEWERRDAHPGPGQVMPDIEVPKGWSQQALNIAAKLYLSKGKDSAETSIRQLIHRVCYKISREGYQANYFSYRGSPSVDSDIFYDEMVYICLHQIATFNSPVWFNIGREDRKQCPSACFILDVEDTTASIMEWVKEESDIFRAGSGSGVNPSKIRSSVEPLSTGGIASGPVSFMRISNAAAETIKSGGTTRRAAKIVQLDCDHPDIVDFINAKVREEDRLRILGEAGVNIGFSLEGERNVAEVTSFQSANNSVRVTDEFMRAAQTNENWPLNARKARKHDGLPEVLGCVQAGDLLYQMADAVYKCADPGIMFHDTINSWHTTPNDAPITCTNPCGELHTPNNSSCNLGSLNVLKFVGENNVFDVKSMRHVVDVMTLAMDILVDFCELPTAKLTRRTKEFRWLGLGFSNMGAAIMAQGWPYDSDEGRDFAASFMALETGRSYRMSAQIAERVGAFDGFEANREAMLEVMDRHHSFLPSDNSTDIWHAAKQDWVDVLIEGSKHGFRNAQATVIPPAGTTSFFMDCDTTGIEPAFSLVTYKSVAGGGSMTLVSQTVRRALEAIGHTTIDIEDEVEALRLGGVEHFLPLVEPEHRVVFDGANQISAEGHIRMLAAVQPFISGAASKTINLPETATREDIRECFELAWRLGVKCIAVYRNNSKVRQVLSSKPKTEAKVEKEIVVEVAMPVRKRLPRTRSGKTHKIHVRGQLGEHEGYVTVGTYPDGTIGEMFLEGFGRLGGFTQNVLSAWATSVSLSLQYGVPIEVQMRKHVGHCDETGGMVVPAPGEKLVVRSCSSIIDYIARWIISEFGSTDLQEELGVMTDAVKARKIDGVEPTAPGLEDIVMEAKKRALSAMSNGNGHAKSVEMSANSCQECRIPMQRTGACWTCSQCGYNTGCG